MFRNVYHSWPLVLTTWYGDEGCNQQLPSIAAHDEESHTQFGQAHVTVPVAARHVEQLDTPHVPPVTFRHIGVLPAELFNDPVELPAREIAETAAEGLRRIAALSQQDAVSTAATMLLDAMATRRHEGNAVFVSQCRWL